MEKRNLRDIAQQLGVAHVLEGSVQRAGDRVRVTAQLIDARTDAHLWADHYDGELADVFAIQTEIAQKIVAQLRSVLSPGEQAALTTAPTSDPAAYDFYLKARELHRNAGTGSMAGLNALEQIKLLDQAVARDPAFVPALCMLAQAHLRAFWYKQDHTPGRLELAKTALDYAARLQPDAGEVHLTRALYHYWGSRAYSSALAELALASRSLPNDVDILFYIGVIERRQGRWDESVRALERARSLDPRNSNIALDLSWSYRHLARYDDAKRVIDDVLAWKPEDMTFQFIRADIDFNQSADLTRFRQLFAREMPPNADANLIAIYRNRLALFEKNYVAAEEALSGYRLPEITSHGFSTPVAYYEGVAAQGRGDTARAEDAFRRAHERAAALVDVAPRRRESTDDPRAGRRKSRTQGRGDSWSRTRGRAAAGFSGHIRRADGAHEARGGICRGRRNGAGAGRSAKSDCPTGRTFVRHAQTCRRVRSLAERSPIQRDRCFRRAEVGKLTRRIGSADHPRCSRRVLTITGLP